MNAARSHQKLFIVRSSSKRRINIYEILERNLLHNFPVCENFMWIKLYILRDNQVWSRRSTQTLVCWLSQALDRKTRSRLRQTNNSGKRCSIIIIIIEVMVVIALQYCSQFALLRAVICAQWPLNVAYSWWLKCNCRENARARIV